MKSRLVASGMLALILSGTALAQTVRRVPQNYARIQLAIAAAANGDTVLVSPGTYAERLDLLDKRIVVRSTDGPEVTIVDAALQGPVVRITGSTTSQTVLDGFTLTHGRSDPQAGGIQISNAQPVIRNNIIVENNGGFRGDGISVLNSSALIVHNRIVNNSDGVGIFGNGGGGGIYVSGDPCAGTSTPSPTCGTEIRDNLIEGNVATPSPAGGGILVDGGGPVRIIGNVIRNNESLYNGGGITIRGSDVRVENNLIAGNQMLDGGAGGGILLSVGIANNVSLINNTIVRNLASYGSGVYASGAGASTRFLNNLIIGSAGTTVLECRLDSSAVPPPIVRNNNVVANGGVAYAERCSGAAGIDGNLSAMPIFAAAEDYRLAPGSPGIDAGNKTYAIESTDLLHAPRVVDGDHLLGAEIDIGAYETGDTIFVSTFSD